MSTEREASPDAVGRLLKVAAEMMDAATYASLVTMDEGGLPSSRAVRPFPPVGDDFSKIVVATHPDSRKTRHVRANPNVLLSYVDALHRGYVTVVGEATLNDRLEDKRAYWVEASEAFWPGGPDSSDYLLIDVVPQRIEMRSFVLGVADDPHRWSPVTLERSAAGPWKQSG